MNDLTNNSNVELLNNEKINLLLVNEPKKYHEVLRNFYINLKFIVNSKFTNRSNDEKISVAYVTYEIIKFLDYEINNLENIIVEYFTYYDENYENFIKNTEIINDWFVLNLSFYKGFIKKYLKKYSDNH